MSIFPGRVSRSSPVFIVATGRSGTHFLAEILSSDPRLRVLVEKQPYFRLSTAMALDPRKEKLLMPWLVLGYRYEAARSFGRRLIEKSHPNIWLAEKLAKAFPNSLFLGIQRDVYGTVASMLKHDGVLSWQQHWREFPVPNRFLGIDTQWVDRYEQLSPAGRCALRWSAHQQRMSKLRDLLGSRLLVLEYEALVLHGEQQRADLQEFLDIENPFRPPLPLKESVNKWKSHLSARDMVQIDEVIAMTRYSGQR